MKIAEECRECILKRANGILLREGNTDTNIIELIQNRIDLEITSGTSWVGNTIAPAQLGSIRQEILRNNGLGDTFHQERSLGMIIGKELFDLYYEKATLIEAILLAMVGNGIEFDVGGVYNLDTNIIHEYKEALGNPKLISEAREIADLIEDNQGQMIYFLDNIGEHYCDAVFIKQLRQNGWNVTVVANESPVLNDVTVSEIEDNPFFRNIISTGKDDVGTFYSRLSPSVQTKIDNADMIIIKGMANFESLSRHIFNQPALFLMKAKCHPVARASGVRKGEYVIHLEKSKSSWL